MEFLDNFALNIVLGLSLMFVLTECTMNYLFGNARWRISLTRNECIVTITSVFTLTFIGGYVGVQIQESFAYASSNFSLITGEYTPPENFTAMAPKGEANFFATIFAALFSLPHLYINSYWISKRKKLYWTLKSEQLDADLKYSKKDAEHVTAKQRFEHIKRILYKDVNGYCP
ncbi:MAG: hypothetical protein VX154_08420 [Pseudomonadota bacterium]|nr:hypothetical protein [Pseudomonadota bacterium]